MTAHALTTADAVAKPSASVRQRRRRACRVEQRVHALQHSEGARLWRGRPTRRRSQLRRIQFAPHIQAHVAALQRLGERPLSKCDDRDLGRGTRRCK